jgi:hypothetical protein
LWVWRGLKHCWRHNAFNMLWYLEQYGTQHSESPNSEAPDIWRALPSPSARNN